MITASWDDGTQTQTFTIPDAGLGSLEKYRLSMTRPVDFGSPSGPTLVPIYATVLDMIVATIVNGIVRPAFSAYPPDEVQQAAQAVAAAQDALKTMQEQALAMALSPEPSRLNNRL